VVQKSDTPVLVYVLLGRTVTEYRRCGGRNTSFMRHEFLVLTVKKLLKSVYIYGCYRKIKSGVSLFYHPVHCVHIKVSPLNIL